MVSKMINIKAIIATLMVISVTSVSVGTYIVVTPASNVGQGILLSSSLGVNQPSSAYQDALFSFNATLYYTNYASLTPQQQEYVDAHKAEILGNQTIKLTKNNVAILTNVTSINGLALFSYAEHSLGIITYKVIYDGSSFMSSSSYEFNIEILQPVVIPTNYTLTISINPSNAGTTAPSAGEYIYQNGTIVDITQVNNAGYHFSNWTLDGITISTTTLSVMMNRTHLVIANFELDPIIPVYYSLYFTSPTGVDTTTITPSPDHNGQYNAGREVTISVTLNTGYKIISWAIDSQILPNQQGLSITISMNKDHTVVLILGEITRYTLTITKSPSTVGSVTLEPANGPYLENTDVIMRAYGNEAPIAYNFHKWTINGSDSSQNPYTIRMDSNKVVTAYFVEVSQGVPVTIKSSPKSGVAITVNGSAIYDVTEKTYYIKSLTTFSVSLNDADNNIFNHWEPNGETTREISVSVAGIYTAIYNPPVPQYTGWIFAHCNTLSSDLHISINGKTTPFNFIITSVTTFTAPSNDNDNPSHPFKNWDGITGSGNIITVSSSGNHTAYYEKLLQPSFGVQFSASPMFIYQNGTGYNILTITRTDFSGDISVTTSNDPEITITFSVNPIRSSTLQPSFIVFVHSNARVGDHLIYFTFTGAGCSTVVKTLIVRVQGYSTPAFLFDPVEIGHKGSPFYVELIINNLNKTNQHTFTLEYDYRYVSFNPTYLSDSRYYQTAAVVDSSRINYVTVTASGVVNDVLSFAQYIFKFNALEQSPVNLKISVTGSSIRFGVTLQMVDAYAPITIDLPTGELDLNYIFNPINSAVKDLDGNGIVEALGNDMTILQAQHIDITGDNIFNTRDTGLLASQNGWIVTAKVETDMYYGQYAIWIYYFKSTNYTSGLSRVNCPFSYDPTAGGWNHDITVIMIVNGVDNVTKSSSVLINSALTSRTVAFPPSTGGTFSFLSVFGMSQQTQTYLGYSLIGFGATLFAVSIIIFNKKKRM